MAEAFEPSPNRRTAFVVIADPTRREVLELPRYESLLRAGETASNFKEVSRPGISRQLRVLKECGVVSAEHVGQTRPHSLCQKPLIEIQEGWLAGFSENQTKSLARLRMRVESSRLKKSKS